MLDLELKSPPDIWWTAIVRENDHLRTFGFINPVLIVELDGVTYRQSAANYQTRMLLYEVSSYGN